MSGGRNPAFTPCKNWLCKFIVAGLTYVLIVFRAEITSNGSLSTLFGGI